jgi:hypothetical protein
MAIFDQRNQNVVYQYNVNGNINFGAVATVTDIVIELQKLLDETTKAVKAGVVDAEIGVDVEAKVKKAIVLAEKPKPEKQSILDNINGAIALIEGIVSAVGLVSGFAQAAEVVKRIL